MVDNVANLKLRSQAYSYGRGFGEVLSRSTSPEQLEDVTDQIILDWVEATRSGNEVAEGLSQGAWHTFGSTELKSSVIERLKAKGKIE
jgi:hypothetical protein